MARIKELFEMYKDVDEEKLFNNLVYFLKAIQPVCEKYDIRMAIHPDDPAGRTLDQGNGIQRGRFYRIARSLPHG